DHQRTFDATTDRFDGEPAKARDATALAGCDARVAAILEFALGRDRQLATFDARNAPRVCVRLSLIDLPTDRQGGVHILHGQFAPSVVRCLFELVHHHPSNGVATLPAVEALISFPPEPFYGLRDFDR